jgi:hypothetical protein
LLSTVEVWDPAFFLRSRDTSHGSSSLKMSSTSSIAADFGPVDEIEPWDLCTLLGDFISYWSDLDEAWDVIFAGASVLTSEGFLSPPTFFTTLAIEGVGEIATDFEPRLSPGAVD